jgi:hypothetical protein
MALAPLIVVVAVLATIAVVWSPIAVLAIVVVALAGRLLCGLTGPCGERFFIGGGADATHRHRLH